MTTIHSQTAKTIHDACVQYGEFTLASGKKSNVYVDLRKFTFSSDVQLLFHLFKEKMGDIDPQKIDAIGGPALGAVPLATMYVTMLGYKMKSFAVRKAAKEHGMQNQIEGPVEPGDKVVVFEDVTTSGNSGLQAVQALREFGCEVLRVITVADRNEGGTELYSDNDVSFDRIFTIQEILSQKE